MQLGEVFVDRSFNARDDLRVLQRLAQFCFFRGFGCEILFDCRAFIRQRLVSIHIGDPVDIHCVGLRRERGRYQADHQRKDQQQSDESPHVIGLLYVRLLKKHRTPL